MRINKTQFSIAKEYIISTERCRADGGKSCGKSFHKTKKT